MIKIPDRLKDENFRFIKVVKKNKIPIGEGWQIDNNFSYKDNELLDHLRSGGNYGVVSGFGNLIIIDCDDKLTEKELGRLPNTFKVRTGGGGVHAFYYSNLADKMVLRDPLRIVVGKDGKKEFKHIGEIQANGAMVVGPNSVHISGKKYEIINDIPISYITKEQIVEVFGKYHTQKLKKPRNLFENSEIFQDPVIEIIKGNIKVSDLMKRYNYNLKKNPTECLLGHESRNKRNFSYNDEEGLWHCFNCLKGGDIFNLIMEHENIDFVESKERLKKEILDGSEEELSKYKDVKSEKVDELFKDFESLFRISVKKPYLPAIKALFYSLQGHALKENVPEIGMFHEDLRNSFVLSIRSGGRKQGFVDVIKKTAEKMGWSCSSIQSLHEEQLIGRSDFDKKTKEVIEKRGYLNEEILVLNDSLSLINDPKFELARNYLMQSQDTFGKNFITKRLTSQSKEQSLNYLARCSCFFFIQPENIIYENISTGWERRFPFIQIDIPDKDRERAMMERFSDDYKPYWDPWITHLKKLESRELKIWRLPKETQEKINELTNIIVKHFKKIQGVRGKMDFGENRRFKFSDDLVIYSMIVSEIEGSDEVTPRHAIIAFKDYMKIAEASFNHFITYVKRKSMVESNIIEDEMINLLKEKKCFSEEESNLTISEFKNIIHERTGKSLNTIQYHHRNLIKKGIISRKQTRRDDTKVWLNKE